MNYTIERSSGTGDPLPSDAQNLFRQLNNHLDFFESQIIDAITKQLQQAPRSRNRSEADKIFGIYSQGVLHPYSHLDMGSRAAVFSSSKLIPTVLLQEKTLGCQFHKGALFYDTALAYLISGDDYQFEYFIAMVDQEEFLTQQAEGLSPVLGHSNLRNDGISVQTFRPRLHYLENLLNGQISSSTITFKSFCGSEVSEERLNVWRKTLDQLHHYELFRVLKEIEVFIGRVPYYPSVLNNPYILLRLAKALAHLAQWVESDLTQLQSGNFGKTLHAKLKGDPDFDLYKNPSLAGSNFPSRAPDGISLDNYFSRLISDVCAATTIEEKSWRVLTLLYNIRNSTAHTIDPALPIYSNRSLLLELIQVVLLSLVVIRKQKRASIP